MKCKNGRGDNKQARRSLLPLHRLDKRLTAAHAKSDTSPTEFRHKNGQIPYLILAITDKPKENYPLSLAAVDALNELAKRHDI